MKTVNRWITRMTACLLLAGGLPALADDARVGGMIREINPDQHEMQVGTRYYRLDSHTVVHGPAPNSFVGLDALKPGVAVVIQTRPAAAGDVLPRAAEIWIRLD